MARVFEIAHNLRMPGAHIEAALHPKNLTARIFNSARAMIASGVVKGNGGAAQVARHVLKARNVTHLRTTGYGILRCGRFDLPRTAHDEALECYEAYIMVQKANDDIKHRNYWDDRLKDAHKFFDNLPNSRWVSISSPELRERIAKILADARSDLTKQNTADLLKQFDAGEPFPINVFED